MISSFGEDSLSRTQWGVPSLGTSIFTVTLQVVKEPIPFMYLTLDSTIVPTLATLIKELYLIFSLL